MCLDKKVIAGLAAIAAAVYLFAPGVFGAALPLLILAACPLSMIVMMRAMSGSSGKASCHGAASPDGAEAELAELRAEVERLRREQHARRDTTAGAREPS